MSFKTDRLVTLFPEAFAATEPGSLLYRILDAIGHEFMSADEAVKKLLKSHWVDYASGGALDGLAAVFGIQRRRLLDGTPESDELFRTRLKGVVPYFTGGGTVKAIKGAVRSALGLPIDLEVFRNSLPSRSDLRIDALINGLEKLIEIEEFSPATEKAINGPVVKEIKYSRADIEINIPSVLPSYPRIEWTFVKGGGRLLSVELLDKSTGFKSTPDLLIHPGNKLVLTSDSAGILNASIGTDDVSSFFVNLDGSTPARLPLIPITSSKWRFLANSALFDISAFDSDDGFDLPDFSIEMSWKRFTPLSFDVTVPYFLKDAVDAIRRESNFQGELFVLEGVSLDTIQQVVNQTKAAGVKGSVHLSLNFVEWHDSSDSMQIDALHKHDEMLNLKDEGMTVINEAVFGETQNADDNLALGGVFDISDFDSTFGFE